MDCLVGYNKTMSLLSWELSAQTMAQPKSITNRVMDLVCVEFFCSQVGLL